MASIWKIRPAHRVRDKIVKKIRSGRELSHEAQHFRFCTRIQKLGPKTVHKSRATLTDVKFFWWFKSESIRCESFRLVYSLSRQRRPRSSDQRGLGNGASVQIGGGVHVGDASKSDIGSQPIAMWEW